MASFVALNKSSENIKKCLNAIQTAYKQELWLSKFIENSNNMGDLDSFMNVTLTGWDSIKSQGINWQYIKTYAQEAAYYYEDSNGRMLHIASDSNRCSKVYHILGFPEEIESQLNGLTNAYLYENIDRYIKPRLDSDDFDLRIAEYIQ